MKIPNVKKIVTKKVCITWLIIGVILCLSEYIITSKYSHIVVNSSDQRQSSQDAPHTVSPYRRCHTNVSIELHQSIFSGMTTHAGYTISNCSFRQLEEFYSIQPVDLKVFKGNINIVFLENSKAMEVVSAIILSLICVWVVIGVLPFAIRMYQIYGFCSCLAVKPTMYAANAHLEDRIRALGSLETLQDMGASVVNNYNVYLSCAGSDSEFISDKIIPFIEGKLGFKACFRQRDFLPGEYFCSSITQSMRQCNCVMIFLSKAFMKSGWCKYEFAEAKTLLVNGLLGRNKLMVWKLEDCILPDYYGTIGTGSLKKSIDWTMERNQRPAWKKLETWLNIHARHSLEGCEEDGNGEFENNHDSDMLSQDGDGMASASSEGSRNNTGFVDDVPLYIELEPELHRTDNGDDVQCILQSQDVDNYM